LTEILQVLCLLKGTGDSKFFLLFFDLVAVVVPNGDMFPTQFLLFDLGCEYLLYRLFRDVLVGRLFDCGLTLQHVLDG
jgi:hypothetical protein